jgi:calcineurin-like phosphoesterase family protein
MTVFFTSDTHFGDRRVLQIDRRPFGSVAFVMLRS